MARVLVAEDENAVREFVTRALNHAGHDVVAVADGLQALGALSGGARMGAYAAAKSAVIRLSESLSRELREDGVNVNCVLPSIIDSPANRRDMPKSDPKRWVAPEDLAEVIAFLASPRARAIHGAAIPVVGLS